MSDYVLNTRTICTLIIDLSDTTNVDAIILTSFCLSTLSISAGKSSCSGTIVYKIIAPAPRTIILVLIN